MGQNRMELAPSVVLYCGPSINDASYSVVICYLIMVLYWDLWLLFADIYKCRSFLSSAH